MINIHEEIGVQCIKIKSEDQTHIEIRIDFNWAVIFDTRKFFMA